MTSLSHGLCAHRCSSLLIAAHRRLVRPGAACSDSTSAGLPSGCCPLRRTTTTAFTLRARGDDGKQKNELLNGITLPHSARFCNSSCRPTAGLFGKGSLRQPRRTAGSRRPADLAASPARPMALRRPRRRPQPPPPPRPAATNRHPPPLSPWLSPWLWLWLSLWLWLETAPCPLAFLHRLPAGPSKRGKKGLGAE